MPSLKDLLRSTLTAWLGSHKSVPVSNWIYVERTIQAGIEHIDENAYVAPSDGVFSIQSEYPATVLTIRKNGMDWVCGSPTEGPWQVFFVPCRKGETINFSANSTEQTVNCFLRFYKYVGEE